MLTTRHKLSVRVVLAGLFTLCAPLACADETAHTKEEPSVEALAFNCFTCHGPGGQSPAAMPSLNGKSANYMLRRLREFKQGKGSPTIMQRIARGYSDAQLARIAQYLARER